MNITKFEPYATQIVFAYEELSLTPAQIAEQFEESGISEEVVSALLVKHSRVYSEMLRTSQSKAESGVAVMEDGELDELLHEYRKLSKFADSDLVKERALKFLINEKRGRNDIPQRLLELKQRDTEATEINTAMKVAEFNEHMSKINATIAKICNSGVETTKQLA